MKKRKSKDIKTNEFTLENNEILNKSIVRKSMIGMIASLAIAIISFILNLRFGNFNAFKVAPVFQNDKSNYFYFVFLVLAFCFFGFILIYYNFVLSHNKEEKTYQSKLKFYKIYDYIQFILVCIGTVWFFVSYIFTPCQVVGSSMSETYHNGDRLIVWNLYYNPSINDIVVIDGENYVNDEKFLVKRIVAVEDSVIEYRVNGFYVNDELIEKEYMNKAKYLSMISSIGYEEDPNTPITVPKNKILVFGDNRGNSLDSRNFGFVDKDDIFGVVLFRFLKM